jgi:hypothetical protein
MQAQNAYFCGKPPPGAASAGIKQKKSVILATPLNLRVKGMIGQGCCTANAGFSDGYRR